METFLQHNGTKVIWAFVVCVLGAIIGFIWQRFPLLREIVNDATSDNEQYTECRNSPLPPDEFSALTPQMTMQGCEIRRDYSNTGGIVHRGCKAPLYSTYFVIGEESWHLTTAEQFIEFFAPVETADEALAFALALTDDFAQYEIELPETFRILSDDIRPTSVTTSGDQYIIDLFDFDGCGCAPHTTYQTRVAVSMTGLVKEIASYPAYEDPKFDGLCSD